MVREKEGRTVRERRKTIKKNDFLFIQIFFFLLTFVLVSFVFVKLRVALRWLDFISFNLYFFKVNKEYYYLFY